jgi:hypothetical protein
MVLVNGAGAVAGPIVGATAVGAFGPGGLFVVVGAAYAAVGTYSIYRMTRRAAVPEAERASFSPSPLGLGTTAPFTEADVDELYPPQEGVVVVDGRGFTYREQGAGAPVVIVHDHERGFGNGAVILPALAADGVRAIAPFVAGDAAPLDADDEMERQMDDLLAVLRHLELPSATFVGCGTGADLVTHFLFEHPDRVYAVVQVVDEPVAAPHGGDPHEVPRRLTLVLERSRLDDQPEEVADDIVDFLRHEVGALPGPER